MKSVVISSEYRVTVPKELRDRYDIKPGDHLDWIVDEGGLRLVRVLPNGDLEDFRDDSVLER